MRGCGPISFASREQMNFARKPRNDGEIKMIAEITRNSMALGSANSPHGNDDRGGREPPWIRQSRRSTVRSRARVGSLSIWVPPRAAARSSSAAITDSPAARTCKTARWHWRTTPIRGRARCWGPVPPRSTTIRPSRLEDCPLTLNSLGDDTPGAAGVVKDTGSGLRASPVGVTPLSVNNLVDAPASALRGYAGAGTQEPISESSLAVRGCQAIWRITPSSITATARSRT